MKGNIQLCNGAELVITARRAAEAQVLQHGEPKHPNTTALGQRSIGVFSGLHRAGTAVTWMLWELGALLSPHPSFYLFIYF